MEQINLSQRLRQVAEYIPENSRLADIGSDHAYLPAYAILEKKASFAIAGEVNEGPYMSAKKTVETYGLTDKIRVRHGNGLNVIEKGEVNTLVIAGMGGTLIQTILEEGKHKLTDDMTLILQPNIGAYGLRKWLTERHWVITGEAILEEDGHIYEMMTVQHHDKTESLKEEQLLMGPYLLQKKTNPVFQKKWKAEAEKTKQILMALEKSKITDEIQAKKQSFEEQLEWIERNLL